MFALALVAPAVAAADDDGSATYTVRGATYDFALRNTGSTAWQSFSVAAPAGAVFVGGTTANEGSARCTVGPPASITCVLGVVAGASVEFTAVLQAPVACGAPFQLSVTSAGEQTFTRVGDAVFVGSCAPPELVRAARVRRVGHVVTLAPPAWNVQPEEVAYRWQRCARARCVTVHGATGIRIRSAGLVRVVVTATFDDGTVLRSVSPRI